MSATRILLVYPAENWQDVDGLIAIYNRETVQFELLGIESQADLNSKMTDVRRRLEDVSGILFFNCDFEATRYHVQWLQQIRAAATQDLPSVFVHFPGLITKAAEKELKKQLLYRHPDLSVSHRWPRLTFLLRNGLVALLMKINRISAQRAIAALRPARRKVSREVPR